MIWAIPIGIVLILFIIGNLFACSWINKERKKSNHTSRNSITSNENREAG